MIVVTGAAGFIGSCLITTLNNNGFFDLILVDDFSRNDKTKNYAHKRFLQKIERVHFLDWFNVNAKSITAVFHIGAKTDTTLFDVDLLNALNVNYTKQIWATCTTHAIPLIYASSAATYGLGEFGYDDDEAKIKLLKPLNPYGDSKNEFDNWAIAQAQQPQQWCGFKFFNVYGPNEYHKGRMASVVFHSFNQINQKGLVKLFRSHNPNYTNGGQLRDFIYVKDVVDVLYFAFTSKLKNGIYNLGSGKARPFLDLATATFNALNKQVNIEFIDTPIDIREKYQYFTQATMQKLIEQGYAKPFTSLEDGVTDYVQNYLTTQTVY